MSVTIVTRAGKGSILTHNEVDANFTNLKTAVEAAASDILSLAATAAASYQPLDSDLTAIAALATTAFGRSLLTLADAPAARAAIGAALTAGYIGYGSASGLLTGLGDLRYYDTTGRLVISTSLNSGTVGVSTYNTSAGALAVATHILGNDAGSTLSWSKVGSGAGVSGLYGPNINMYSADTGITLFTNAAAADFIFSRGGFAAGNKVFQIGDKWIATGAGYTVATLPAAAGVPVGARTHVTDASAPTFLGALTGGGAIVCPVFNNGSAWVAG